jgi:phage terminase large subunit-like protein
MVQATLRVIDPNFALLHGQGRVHRLGALPQLEDQMCGFLPAGHGNVDLRPDGYPPDRVDALFWVLTDLLLEPMSNRGIFDLYCQLAQESRS